MKVREIESELKRLKEEGKITSETDVVLCVPSTKSVFSIMFCDFQSHHGLKQQKVEGGFMSFVDKNDYTSSIHMDSEAIHDFFKVK